MSLIFLAATPSMRGSPPLPPTSTVWHSARQVPALALPVTTTSIDWWPYPPWGATTTSSSVANALAGSTISATTVSSISRTVSESSTSHTSFAVTSSSSLTPIHISALPSGPEDSHTPKVKNASSFDSSSSFDIVYLAPLFAVLGVLFGALCAWLLIHWLSHRRASRADNSYFIPGPRYVPPSAASLNAMRQPHNRDAVLPRRRGLSARSTKTQKSGKGSWLGRAFSTSTRRSEKPSDMDELRTPMVERPLSHPHANNSIAMEDDPFLVSTQANSGIAESATRPSQSVGSPRYSDDDDDVPYETLRHKSIRRGILERLKFGTLRHPAVEEREESDIEASPATPRRSPARRVGRRQGHAREDSDCNVEDVGRVARQQTMLATPSRQDSRASAKNAASPLPMSPGFRIIEEDLEADAAPPVARTHRHRDIAGDGSSPKEDSWFWTSPWSSPTKPCAEDKYTALPERRSTAEQRTSPFRMPAMSRTTSSPAPPSMTRVNSSILPSSPPRIMSPPLESKLFFGAVSPDFGATPVLELHMPARYGERSSPAAIERVPTVREGNKLRTKREPPLLPFPSTSASSPYHNRLKRFSKREGSSVPLATHPSGPGIHMDRQTPAARYNARHSALDKVEEIVSRSWSQRDLSSEIHTSPTLFGAIPPVSLDKQRFHCNTADSPQNMGIEQRLQGVMVKGG